MHIMSAGMHYAAVLRAVGHIIALLYRQGIHIRTQCDASPAGPLSFEDSDDAGTCNAGLVFYPPRSKLFRNKCGSIMLLERKLGMRMYMMPYGLYFGKILLRFFPDMF